MKYAVYVKFKTEDGEEQWSGNLDRKDESREEAEKRTVEDMQKKFPIKRILRVISFEYGDEEEAPSFIEETERADKEERKKFALVEIADALKALNCRIGFQGCESNNKMWLIVLVTQILTLLLLILRMLQA